VPYVKSFNRLYSLFVALNVQLQTVRTELQASRDIFTKKTTEQSRHLAWVSAAIISTVS